MSQSDKTRQKLVDSMRKTKSGTTEDNESVSAEEKNKTETPAPKKTSTATGSRTAAKRNEKNTTGKNQADGYQSVRRRVWPD
ncbi:MAG: hypothetical protein RI563_11275 [Thiohalophilus sp.]|uniref:hypothetical protein n=1 Tax=Thiohalophilus sp. TaxID=3028392 RepID=UPI002870955D|nr:hypothetical protein [Thiohalophilus sp.]MDR9437454.1 hypothetical protein [Thiohalophilus sp.]